MWKAKKSTKQLVLELSDQRIDLKALSPQRGVELCLLIGPYVPKFKRVRKILEKDLDPGDAGFRLHQIAETMVEAPGDFLEFVGLLVDRTAEWLAQNTTALEILEVLPAVLEFHEFEKLLVLGEALGFWDLGE